MSAVDVIVLILFNGLLVAEIVQFCINSEEYDGVMLVVRPVIVFMIVLLAGDGFWKGLLYSFVWGVMGAALHMLVDEFIAKKRKNAIEDEDIEFVKQAIEAWENTVKDVHPQPKPSTTHTTQSASPQQIIPMKVSSARPKQQTTVETQKTYSVSRPEEFRIENGELKEYMGRAEKLIIPSGVTSIFSVCFSNYKNFYELEIPDSLEEIASSIFSGCKNLEKVKLPRNLKKIGICAFSDCIALREITVPEKLTEIGDFAFAGCESLKKFNFPLGLIRIGKYAFTSTALEQIILPAGVSFVGESAFSGCKRLVNADISSLTYISEKMLDGCGTLRTVRFSPDTTAISAYAFRGCEKLQKIDLPSSVRTIGEKAFACCDALTTVSIPEGITAIECSTFYSCRNLKYIMLPNSVMRIDSEAFMQCSNLEFVSIPTGCVVAPDAFSFCPKLKR